MNIDELFEQMHADDIADLQYCTPVQYSKIRPVSSPQLYQWMRTGKLTWKHCDCGRRVIEVAAADDLLRSKGKLPPSTKDNNED